MLLILGFAESSNDSESIFAQGQSVPSFIPKERGACHEEREALVTDALREN
jgi:hypothetical protein